LHFFNFLIQEIREYLLDFNVFLVMFFKAEELDCLDEDVA